MLWTSASSMTEFIITVSKLRKKQSFVKQHGDINGDGTVNYADADDFVSYYVYKYGVTPLDAQEIQNRTLGIA